MGGPLFTSLDGRRSPRQPSLTGETRPLTHPHWEFTGRGMGAGWQTLEVFQEEEEEEMGLAGRI